MKLLLILLGQLIFCSPSFGLSRSSRDELHRYTLMRDRIIVERSIKDLGRNNYFMTDFHFSSGLIAFTGEVDNIVDNPNLNDAEKQSQVQSILSKHANTGKYADLENAISIPLPEIKHNKYHFYPTVFVSHNISGSMSVSSDEDFKAFIKKDLKYGLYSYITVGSQFMIESSLYQLKRKELYTTKTSSQIVGDRKLANARGLGQEQSSIRIDFKISKKYKMITTSLKIEEFVLIKDSTTNNYKNSFFIDGRLNGVFKNSEFSYSPFIGMHRRERYSLFKGLYVGTKIDRHDFPIKGMFILDGEILTLSFSAEYRWLNAGYTVKLPHQNPVDNTWVSKIHSLMISVPF